MLFSDEQLQRLIENGKNPGGDYKPVVKLFTPFARMTWLLTEIDPDEHDMAFGLCDLGLGFPELGYVYLPEITETLDKLRLRVECDEYFEGKYPITIYAEAARRRQCITDDDQELSAALTRLTTPKPQAGG